MTSSNSQNDSLYMFPSWPLGVRIGPQNERKHKLVSPVSVSCVVEICLQPPLKKKGKKAKQTFSSKSGVTRFLKHFLCYISSAEGIRAE